mgnify:CR=1 FL=1|tara:strand:- start:48 stop:710 length:663 start_codon:yes stop_codon:yes gene_type:complete
MKVLSFDIGIKNLSYCLVCKDSKKIYDWGIINICCDDECQHINTKNNKCDKKASFISDNNILICSQHSKNKKYTKVKKYKNSSTLFDTGIKLLEKIKEKKFNNQDIEDVLLENQPVLKNPTMKSIQMILYSYFLNQVIDNKKIKKVEMINARNKLKAYKGEEIICDIKDKYKRTKYLGIKYCERMIIDDKEEFIDLFNNSKKKDDLSDSYLQAIYYINLN